MTDKPDLTPSSIKDPPTVSYTTGSGGIILIFAVSLLLLVGAAASMLSKHPVSTAGVALFKRRG